MRKLPRNHAYIDIRNNGLRIRVDYPTVNSEEAEGVMELLGMLLREAQEKESENGKH